MTAKCPTCDGTGQAPGTPYTQEQLAGEIWALEEANRLYPARWPMTPPVKAAPPRVGKPPVMPAPPKAKAPPVAPAVTPVPVSCGIARESSPDKNPAPVPPPPAKPAKRVKGVTSHGIVLPAPLTPFEREEPPWDLPLTPPCAPHPDAPPAVIAQEPVPPEPLPKPVPPQMPPLAKPAVKEAWAWTPDVFDALRDGFVLPRDANTKQILALLDLSLFRPGDPLEWIAAWCLTYRTIRNASTGTKVMAESAAYEATVVWCQHYPLEAERLRTRAKVKEALAQLGLGLKVVKP